MRAQVGDTRELSTEPGPFRPESVKVGLIQIMKENALLKLEEFGQSIWLDFIRRDLITSGELRRLINEVGLRGMASNPAIFKKATFTEGGLFPYACAFHPQMKGIVIVK